MKHFLCLIITSAFLIPFLLEAKSPTYVKLGVNISSFRNEEGKSEPGICFGVGKEFYPIRSFNGFFALELSYVRKKVTLKDRTWPTDFQFPEYGEVRIGDIQISVGYIEIPLRIGYLLKVSKNTHLKFHSGISLSIPVNNKTKIKNIRPINLSPEQKNKYECDYYLLDLDPGELPLLSPFIARGIDWSINLNIGIRVNWKKIFIDLTFYKALNKTGGFTSLTLKDKLDSFQTSIGFIF